MLRELQIESSSPTRKEPEEVSYPFLENKLTSQEKIAQIEQYFRQILIALGMDLSDESIQKTPSRYAKMLLLELFQGLNFSSFPEITTQENTFCYNQIILESQIAIHSMCEHHFLPFLGYCHIAYLPKNKIIGLSKLNRIVEYFSRRPQIQERMTKQIHTALINVLGTQDVAVVVDAIHLCVRMRGVQHESSLTRTLHFSGALETDPHRSEFFISIPKLQDLKL